MARTTPFVFGIRWGLLSDVTGEYPNGNPWSWATPIFRNTYLFGNLVWLVVSNIFIHFLFSNIFYFQLTFIFFRGVGIPPTSRGSFPFLHPPAPPRLSRLIFIATSLQIREHCRWGHTYRQPGPFQCPTWPQRWA